MHNGQDYLKIWAITMIDPATGWLEIVPLETKRVDMIPNLVEQNWLTWYPQPDQVVYNCGTEFMTEFTIMIDQDYDITKNSITIQNPQANTIVERAHQTMGNMLVPLTSQIVNHVKNKFQTSLLLLPTEFVVQYILQLGLCLCNWYLVTTPY